MIQLDEYGDQLESLFGDLDPLVVPDIQDNKEQEISTHEH